MWRSHLMEGKKRDLPAGVVDRYPKSIERESTQSTRGAMNHQRGEDEAERGRTWKNEREKEI